MPTMHPALLVTFEGLCHGVLCLWLWSDGHAPSAGWGQDHYLFQGLSLPLLMPGLWWVATQTSARLAKRPPAPLKGPLGWALALPTLLVMVVPDALIYGLGGFDALGRYAPWIGTCLLVTLLVSSAVAMRKAYPDAKNLTLAGWAGLGSALLLGAVFVR